MVLNMKYSPVSLKTTVCEAFGLKSNIHKNRIGLELEVEGTGIPNPEWVSRYWKIVAEGSLRNGHEFVTGPQCTIGNLDTYLADLDVGLSKAKVELSIRTSTHLHVNVAWFSLEEVYAVIAAFYLIEDTLVKANGKPRMGNLFCLRSRDAEGIFDILIDRATKNSHLQIDQNLRYGALNLNALSKFGSLEFRFMKAMTDTKLLKLWTDNLFHFVHTAKNLGNVREVIFQYKRSKNLEDFYRLFFDEQFVKMLRPHITPDSDILPYLILLDKTLKKVDRPKKVRYNFRLQEDIDIDAIRDFDVPVRTMTATVLKTRSKSELLMDALGAGGPVGMTGVTGIANTVQWMPIPSPQPMPPPMPTPGMTWIDDSPDESP